MAESLRRLVNLGSFNLVQDKLEIWLDNYHLNTTDQNASRCLEVLETNARLQSQLVNILHLISPSSGLYTPEYIRSRLSPYYPYHYGYPWYTEYPSVVLAKDREINNLTDMYESSLKTLETDLTNERLDADDLKAELDKTAAELEDEQRKSVSDKMLNESEIRELKAKLKVSEDECITLRARTGLVDEYERTIRRLRDDIAILSGRREAYINGDIETLKSKSLSLDRPSSPLAADNVTQRVRSQSLITRFNDMFASDRLDAMDILRRYSDDHENNQKIVFMVMQEAFTAAKLAFSTYKMKVRGQLAPTHIGPDTLEEAVQDHINRNVDLFDLPSLVSDVVRALNRSPRVTLPLEVPYTVIQPFIREACKLAWNCSALAHPLDISVATDSELFTDNKYRRSYDSEYTAPLVSHHIWPCLMQGYKVIMKGEAVTRRGGSLSRSRSPSRSASPLRSYSPSRSPSRARSRSPSPLRKSSPIRARSPSPGPTPRSARSGSPSRATSRAATASTSLSHYGVLS